MAFAEASVEAEADFQKFDQEFPAKLREAVTKSTAKVVPSFKAAGKAAGDAFISGVIAAFDRATSAARRAGAEAGRAFASAAEAFTTNIDVGFKQAALSGSRLGEEFRRSAEQFTQAIPVSFAPRPAARIQGQVAGQRYRAGAQEFVNPVPVTFDTRAAALHGAAAGRLFRLAFESQTRGTVLPGGGGVPRLPGTGRIGAGADNSGFLSFLGKLPLLFKVVLASLPLLGPLLAKATLNTFGFVGSLLPLGGILAALPGAITLFAGSLFTITIAAKAIGEIFKRDVGPAFEKLKKDVGQVAVRGLDSDLQKLSKTLLGPVKEGLTQAASGLNFLLVNTIAFFNTAQTGEAIVAVFDSIGVTFTRLGSALPVLFAGLRDVTVSTLPIFNTLSLLLESVIERFGRFLSAAAASGRAFDWVQNAINVLAGLGSIILSTGSILNSIFKAAAGVTGDLVGSLAQAAAQFAFFLKSAEGSAILTTIFQSLQLIAAPLHLTLVALGQAIGPLSQILSILLQVVGALGPVLGALISGLARGLLPIVEALRPALDGLVAGLSAFLAPLGPILTQVGQLIAVAIRPLSEAIGSLLAQLGPALGQLLAAVGQALLPVFQALTPLIAPFADVIVQVTPAIVELVPSITELVVALTPLIPVITSFTVAVVQLLTPLLRLGAQFTVLTDRNLAGVISALAGALSTLAGPLTFASDSMTAFGNATKGIDLAKFGASVLNGLKRAGAAIVEFGKDTIAFFLSLPGRIVDAVKALPGLLAAAFTAAVRFAFESIGREIGFVITFFVEVGPRIIAALLDFRIQFNNFFANLILDAGRAIAAGWDSIVDFFRNAPTRIGEQLAILGQVVGDFFGRTRDTIQIRIGEAVDSVVDFFKGLGPRLLALGPQLLNAGRQLINNFLTGFSTFGEKALDVVSSIGRGLKRWVNDNIIGALEKGLNDNLPFHVNLPRLAKGAFLTTPTLALLAEAGPEVAIPLSDPARARQLADESGLTNIINASSSAATNVRVFIGERELVDMVRVETDNAMGRQAESLLHGPRWVGA